MVSKKVLISLVLISLILLMPLGFALDTILNFKSDKSRKITVRVSDELCESGTLPDGLFDGKQTDDNGKVSITYSSNSQNKVCLSVTTRDLGGNLIYFTDGTPVRTYKSIKTGWIYDIDLTSTSAPVKGNLANANSSESPITTTNTIDSSNTTVVNNTTTTTPVTTTTTPTDTNTSTTSNPEDTKPTTTSTTQDPVKTSSTGLAVGDLMPSIKINWKIVLYSIGVIILLIFIIGFTVVILKRRPSSDVSSRVYFGPKLSKYSEQKELREAEEKLRKVQQEINSLKGRDAQIKEAQRKLEQDRAELERLKRLR